MSPLAQSIRFWLMRRPRPVKVRLHVGKELSEIETGAGVSWARVAETVDSMDATKVEALDEKGTLIRACKPDELAEPDEAEPDAAPAPVVAFDAETERMKLFATLLSNAYKEANQNAQLRSDMAFNTLAGIVDRMVRRDEANSRAIERIRDGLLREAEDRYASAPEGQAAEGMLGQVVGAFLGGAAQGQAKVDAPNGAPTNGKGH